MTGTINMFEVVVASGPTSRGSVSEWELYFARRALAKLKARLGTQGMLDLLAPDIDAGNTALSEWAAASDGKWNPAVTALRVSGLSANDFLSHLESIFHDRPKMLAVQPEHFVVGVSEGRMEVAENLGPHIAHFDIRFTDEVQAVGELLPDHPIRMVGNVALRDGTLIAHLLHQFRNTDTGFDAVLGIYFPQATPEEVIEGHRQHLAVEFTNWIIGAAESLGLATDSPVPVVADGSERYRA